MKAGTQGEALLEIRRACTYLGRIALETLLVPLLVGRGNESESIVPDHTSLKARQDT